MIRALIVDDSKLTHTFLEEALADKGFVVCGHAFNGLEGVRAYVETAPDVVIMDILMPKVDGVQAIREIRSLDPDARIVILTSLDRESLLSAAINAGARDYALKPCDPKDLAETLRRAVTGRSSQSEEATRLSRAFIEVLSEVLPEFGGLRAVHALGGGPWVKRIKDPVGFRIPFKGRFSGAVNYLFERRFARHLLSMTVPDEVDDVELQRDALAEVGNLVTGRVARYLESVHGRFDFSPPEAIEDPATLRNVPPLCRVSTDAGQIEVSLSATSRAST